MFLFGIPYKSPQVVDDYGGMAAGYQVRYQTPIKDQQLGIPKEYYGALTVVDGEIVEKA